MGETSLRIWTILSPRAWGILAARGRLIASISSSEATFRPAYSWMAGQMIRRMHSARPSAAKIPLWGWYRWDGRAKPRPDLRSAAHLPKGSRGVRLELRLPAANVLLSDFDLWHCVLNYSYLPTGEKDDDAFDRKLRKAGLWDGPRAHRRPLTNPRLRMDLEHSWERIFNLAWQDPKGYISRPHERKRIQATFWEIRMDQVCAMTQFVAR